MAICILQDRAVLHIGGRDARAFLQALVTVDMERLQPGGHLFGALLSPQGKIQFDFFIHAAGDDFLIDIDAGRAADFLKRLTLYRLRAQVNFDDRSASHRLVVAWATHATTPSTADARLAALGNRFMSVQPVAQTASENDYHAHRLHLGVPEAGKDFAYDDIFPHDAMMDALQGVDFTKGCYIGQEVVARVQHRSTARKRFYIVHGKPPLGVMGDPLLMDDKAVGVLGGVAGTTGLALLRVDRVGACCGALTLNDQPVSASLPDYFMAFQGKAG